MVFGGGRHKTMDPGFVLLGIRQQDVPVILRELVPPDEFDLVSPSFTVRDVTTEMVVGGSQQETLDPCLALLVIRQLGLFVIFRELMFPDGFDPVLNINLDICLRYNMLYRYC
ncbi:unnamed protein product [Schistosoma margrebowiei]|uniref:Uncharacterized protein n=1 Tax=Schistosoma margrebowiei TaxID=48269 RepID=A0A183LAG7_9TREM|nr:unnamed protein product [Schistosoma margrebowiei]